MAGRVEGTTESRFIEGGDRNQATLLPECLDDYVAADNPVRVIDVFVDELDCMSLALREWSRHPRDGLRTTLAVLLKIYVYGYLNRIQSSRRLEREAQRNVELMWLTGRLGARLQDDRRLPQDNGKGYPQCVSAVRLMCRQLKLFTHAIVAIDGSKFKAVNNRDKNFTPHKLDQRMRQVDESIERYLSALDTADRTEPAAGSGEDDPPAGEDRRNSSEQMRRFERR